LRGIELLWVLVFVSWFAVDLAIVLVLLLVSRRARNRALRHGGVVLQLPRRPIG
jgi:hypothetical protein